MKKDALICIAAGESQLLLIKEAKKLGYSIIAIDQDSNAIGFKVADVSILKSTYDAAPIIIELRKHLDEFNFSGILNRSSGIPVKTSALIANEFLICAYPVNSAETILNKHLLIDLCINKKINIPKSIILSREEDKEFTGLLPAIVKPSLSTIGKSGISYVSDLRDIVKSIDKAFGATMNNHIVIQEYIEGIDVALVSFVQNKNIYPICFIEEMNYFTESQEIKGVGVLIPARISKKIESEIINISETIINDLNIHTSPFMISFRIQKETPYLMEIHLDFGGDLILDTLLPQSLNINVVETGVRLMAGEKVSSCGNISIEPCAVLYNPGEGLNNKREFHVIKDDSFNAKNVLNKFTKRYEELYK